MARIIITNPYERKNHHFPPGRDAAPQSTSTQPRAG
ncbi:hypothetical protein BJ982_000314 [Sphaerisporangium siamense]|uniref:Uncharacterized protein n=1 Tax=Sphaerisporangium siamense TaxID=795645 RepID=A0A7W7G7R0_9ACTN|nr:hypothetical protein [Sphaerisporangium siamense]